jgi:hypothetical protein
MRQAPAAPAPVVGWLLVQGLGEHRLDQIVADRARCTRARLIEQARKSARDETRPPLAHGLRAQAQLPGDLAVVITVATTQHDTRAQGQ